MNLRWPLRWDSYRTRFLGTLGLIVVLGSGSMVAINRHFNERVSTAHAVALSEQTLQRLTGRVAELTRGATVQNQRLKRIVEGQGDTINPAAAVRQFAPMFVANATLTYAGVADPATGGYAFLQRGDGGETTFRSYERDGAGSRILRVEEMDELARVVDSRIDPWTDYDVRTRPFFVTAQNAEGPTWTDSYLFLGNEKVRECYGVTLATPQRSPEGALRAVLDVDISTQELSELVDALQHGWPARVFVLEQRRDGTRRVVVHSDFGNPASGPTNELEDDPLVVATSAALPGDFAALSVSEAMVQVLDIEGATQLITHRVLGGDMHPNWMVVSVLPVSAAQGDLLADQSWLLIALLGVAGVGVLISWWVARGLVKPLEMLGATVATLAESRNRPPRLHGAPSEVMQLDEQFHRLADTIAARERDLVGAEAQATQLAGRLQRLHSALVTAAQIVAHRELSETEMFERLARSCSEALEVSRTAIWERREEDGEHVVWLQVLYDHDEGTFRTGVRLAETAFADYFEPLRRDGAVITVDAKNDPRTRMVHEQRLAADERIALLDLGVFIEGNLVGVFSLQRVNPGSDWSTEEEMLARAMADLVALVLERRDRRRAEDQLQVAAARLTKHGTALAEIAREIGQAEASHDVLRPVIEYCAWALEADSGVLRWSGETPGDYNHVTVYRRRSGQHEPGLRLREIDHPDIFRRIRSARTVVVANTLEDASYRRFFEVALGRVPPLTMLTTSIVSSDRLVAVIEMQCEDLSRDWSPEDRLFLGAVADVVSLHFETQARRVAEAQMEERASRLRRMNTALSAMAMHSQVREGRMDLALREITRVCAQALPVERVGMWLMREDPARLILHNLYVSGGDEYLTDGEILVRTHEPYLAALRTERVVAINDALSDPRTSGLAADYLGSHGIGAMLAAPVRARDEIVGVLSLEHVGGARGWTDDERIFGGAVSDLVSLIVESETRRLLERAENESRERARLLIDNTPLAAIDWDGAFTISGWNPAAKALLGYRAEDVVGGKGWFLVPDNQRRRVLRVWSEMIRRRKAVGDRFETRRADGTILICDWHNSAMTDREGNVIGAISLIEDVTERVRTERQILELNAGLERRVESRTAELQAANERLREVDRLKSEFLATMSHELRTPLNSIIGFSKILKQGMAGPLNEEQTAQIGRVYAAGVHLLELINDLLDLSKIEAGRMRLEPQHFEPGKVLAEVEHLLAPMVAVKGLELRVINEANAVQFWSDRSRFFQVVLNLANNAVKFTERGTITLRMTLGEDRLVVEVTDTGMGIAAEKMAQLFEAFRQVDGSARRRYEGTGLGLYLCRKLVTLLGGEIEVVSAPGKGSTFSFWLPLVAPSVRHDSDAPF